MTQTTDLKHLFEAIAADRNPDQAGLDTLRSFARCAVGGDEGDDAVFDLIETTLKATRIGGSASAQRLLRLPDSELVAVVRFRLRQAAVGRRPLWALLKSITEHVRAAIDVGLAPPPAEPPSTLLRGDRLGGDLVAAAVSYIYSFKPDVERTPSTIAKHLISQYFKVEGATDDTADAETQVRRGRDALRISRELRQHLGSDLLRLLRYRHQGIGLAEIAENENIAVSTVHDRIQTAIEHLREHTRRTRTSKETGRLMLALLSA